MKIWLVIGRTGEYADRQEWLVAACLSNATGSSYRVDSADVVASVQDWADFVDAAVAERACL